MLRFECDYNEGCCPEILEKLQETNFCQTPGYGEDEYCATASRITPASSSDSKRQLVSVEVIAGDGRGSVARARLAQAHWPAAGAATVALGNAVPRLAPLLQWAPKLLDSPSPIH